MKSQSLAVVTAISLASTMPTSAAADAKDALFGAIGGAILNQAINDSKKKKQKQRVVTKKVRSAPSLNSQYSRTERVQIQTALRDRGYAIGTIDGILGKNSRRVIGEFQASLGEASTGQLTSSQFARLVGTAGNQFAAPLVNDRALTPAEVAMLQQSLQVLGFYRGAIDGLPGPSTWSAMSMYQAANGMNPAQTTKVLTLVMASSNAGFTAPPYLMQEAQTHMAAINGSNGFGGQPQQGFGAQAPQTAGFGAPQQSGFGTQQQQQNAFAAPQQQNAFGAPQPGGTFGAQPQTGVNTAFGQQPTQQQVLPQGQNNALFAAPQGQAMQQQVQPGAQAPAPAAQNQLFQQQPGAVAPQPQPIPQGVQQGGALFASTPGAQPQVQQPQSTLDVFSPGAATTTVAQTEPQTLPDQQQLDQAKVLMLTDPNATPSGTQAEYGGVFSTSLGN